jgi:hypothetical protein
MLTPHVSPVLAKIIHSDIEELPDRQNLRLFLGMMLPDGSPGKGIWSLPIHCEDAEIEHAGRLSLLEINEAVGRAEPPDDSEELHGVVFAITHVEPESMKCRPATWGEMQAFWKMECAMFSGDEDEEDAPRPSESERPGRLH